MLNFELTKTRFDKNFIPDHLSRSTTNLINLSKNPSTRAENIQSLFDEINQKFNAYLNDNLSSNTYQIHLSILRTYAWFTDKVKKFPVSEMLEVQIENVENNQIIQGPIGLNFSSYLRDIDFHVHYPKIMNSASKKDALKSFGMLHGLLFKLQFKKYNRSGLFESPAVIAISVSETKEYIKNGLIHPYLGEAYIEKGEKSITSQYFKKMGLQPSFFMPKYAQAPLAFFHEQDDLLNRSKIELYSIIAVMQTLQEIYRPEIYCSLLKAGSLFKPSLSNKNFVQPRLFYDRDERNNKLIRNQSDFAEEYFMHPNNDELTYLTNNYQNLFPGLSMN